MDLYGVQAADAEAVVSMAIGGQTASQLFEGERKFDIRIRFQPEYRKSEAEIGELDGTDNNRTKFQSKKLLPLRTLTGPSLISEKIQNVLSP